MHSCDCVCFLFHSFTTHFVSFPLSLFTSYYLFPDLRHGDRQNHPTMNMLEKIMKHGKPEIEVKRRTPAKRTHVPQLDSSLSIRTNPPNGHCAILRLPTISILLSRERFREESEETRGSS